MTHYTKPLLTKLFLIVFVCIGQLTVFGQEQLSETYKKLIQKFPDDSYIRLDEETHIEIEIEDDSLKITQTFYEEDLFLDKSANYKSKKSINFSAFFELESIEAKSLIFENNKYRTYDVEDFTEKDDLDSSFHDDTKSLSFIYPKLNKGSKTQLKYSEIVKDPRFLSPFYFADFFPVEKRKIILKASKDITLDFKEFNLEGYDISFSKEESRRDITYTWEIKNAKKVKYESNIPNYQNVLPHIVPIITSYEIDGKKIEVLGDVSNLINWYSSLTKDLNKAQSDDDLVELVKSITKGANTDLEKVKAIYYWTQKNIKYIAFEYALGGFIPREANDVFKKKYGDCKDNSSILLEMLKIAGLEGNLTWIGTRKIPYSYEELPTPMVDNHMILSYRDNNVTYFLDATGRYLPIEMPSSFIQGKEALIKENNDSFRVEKVPVVDASKNKYNDKSEIKIKDDTLIGSGQSKLYGYNKIDVFNRLEALDNPDEETAFYKNILAKGNNKFLIQNFKETNKYSYDKPFEVTYDFTLEDYINAYGDEVFVNLNFNRTLIDYKTEKDRIHDIELPYKHQISFQNTLEIPEGYAVEYLPENFNLSNDYFSCAITYQKENNKIIYKHNITINYLTLNASEQSKVNSDIKKIEKQYKETIAFRKQ